MGIAPSSNTIVTFPTGAVEPGGNPVLSQISDTQKSIFQTFSDVGTSALLQNPVASAIGGLQNNISSILGTINDSTCLSGGDKTALTNAFSGTGGLSQQIALFKAHTDSLSGVATSVTGGSPALDQILSVGQSLNSIANVMEGSAGCLALLNNMSGLFSQDLLNGFGDEIAGFLSQINNCIADVTAILSRIAEIKNAIAGIIAADSNFFQDSLNKLRQAALAGLLASAYNDPCAKFILENTIGRTDLLAKLQGT